MALKEIRALPTEEQLDASGTAKSNLDLAVVDNHGHIAAATRVIEHCIERRFVLFDILVDNLDLS
ncbi:MAG: hypothetical protein JSW50_15850 [Candidatus Latescibacterota bacterium]|nr:MAG: hypothetical protein JSW50_15850 [Candidatus Latescibacterota bacterium]